MFLYDIRKPNWCQFSTRYEYCDLFKCFLGNYSCAVFCGNIETKTNNCMFHINSSHYQQVTPWALKDTLIWVKENFKNPEIYITENGMGDADGSQDDMQRLNYYKVYKFIIIRYAFNYKYNISGLHWGSSRCES